MLARPLIALLLINVGGFSEALAAPAAPPVLARYIHDGSLDPGEYEFVRGAFPGATPQQATDWSTIKAYTAACVQEAANVQNAALKTIGIVASVPKDRGYQDRLCSQVLYVAEAPEGFADWKTFKAALARSLPYFQVFSAGISASINAVGLTDATTLEERATARIIPDQAWRAPLGLGAFDTLSGIDTDTLRMLKTRTERSIDDVDWDNSHWVRHLLETTGWSAVIKAGPRTAKMVWLMVQHADNDPVFQALALRQLAPYARTGRFDRPNFALLTDRVMLATTGKQHYGSQLSCQQHHYAPFSLDAGGDDPTVLDKRRAKMDLPPEAKYLTYLPPHC